MLDVAEGIRVFLPDIRLYPADGEVHDGEAAGGGIAFLSVDGDVPELASVAFHELFRLDEHPAGAAGGIVDAPLVGGEHLDKAAHHAGGGVELPAVLPLRTGEAGEEILIHPPEQINGAVRLLPLAGGGELDGGDEVDQLAQPVLVQPGAGVILGQHAFEPDVVPLQRDHGIVHRLTDGRFLRLRLEVGPAGIGRHPENILRLVFIRILGIRPLIIPLPGQKLGPVLLKGIGDVFQEDQAEHDMLVLRRIHVVPQLVSGQPELRLEAEVSAGVLGGLGGFFAGGHFQWEF